MKSMIAFLSLSVLMGCAQEQPPSATPITAPPNLKQYEGYWKNADSEEISITTVGQDRILVQRFEGGDPSLFFEESVKKTSSGYFEGPAILLSFKGYKDGNVYPEVALKSPTGKKTGEFAFDRPLNEVSAK